MKPFKAAARAIAIAVLACLPALAQVPDAGADMPVTAAERGQLIDSLIRQVRGSYVFPDKAGQVADRLRAQQARGAYDGMRGARQLSEALTQELQATTRDRHLRVTYHPDPLPGVRPDAGPSPEQAAARLAMLRSNNFWVKKIEHLPFNIGYLALDGFAPAKEAAGTVAAAMTVLAHTDALIIDLRNNAGGDAAGVALLAGYLFDRRTRLNDFYYRAGNRIEQRWSAEPVAGLRYGQHKDVYLLTSRDTFSAGEDFSYALKNLKRATLVGETTGGGANPGEDIRLLPHFSAFMPLGRSVSPVTQTNWEGVGVAPDIAVCAGDAMRTAQLAILRKMAASAQDSARRGRLEERIAQLGTGDGGACP